MAAPPGPCARHREGAYSLAVLWCLILKRSLRNHFNQSLLRCGRVKCIVLKDCSDENTQ